MQFASILHYVRKMLLALAAVYCGIDIVFDIVTPIQNYFTEEP
jgi:hypothetical protein